MTEEDVESEDFVHKFVITLNAVARTHRHEKITLLSNFVRNGSSANIETDLFDEYLQIVEELSVREIVALCLLDTYERANPNQTDENDLQRATRFWPKFLEEVSLVTGMKITEVESFLTRISRTGCYELFIGGYTDYTGGKGKLSPLFSTLKKMTECDEKVGIATHELKTEAVSDKHDASSK